MQHCCHWDYSYGRSRNFCCGYYLDPSLRLELPTGPDQAERKKGGEKERERGG